MTSLDSFKCRKKLTVGNKTYHYFSFKAAEKHGLPDVSESAVFDEDLAREPAPLRGRPLGHDGKTSKASPPG